VFGTKQVLIKSKDAGSMMMMLATPCKEPQCREQQVLEQEVF
jgi:hypothetical protein